MAQTGVGTEDPSHANYNEASLPGTSTVGGNDMQRADSSMSQSHTITPSRGGTLKKRQSLSRKTSLKRSGSKKGSQPGSVKGLTFADDVGDHGSEMHSAFFTPVPTSGSPTEILANRFQVWRRVLKDLITYFRDIQKSYDARSKSLHTLSNVISNITTPSQFLSHGGIGDAIHVLRDYHKQSIAEANKAKSIEEEVIVQLTGLRSDLGQKIKEIKGLSGDFKNNVDKETEGTRRAVRDLQDALESLSTDPKSDPYLVRLGVDRQLGRQMEEENYLHRAFLNLESSGRELESIVMGEIQKAYNAYAGIIKREADEAYEATEKLRSGPLAISKDYEWKAFVDNNEHFVDPRLPVRRVENITYPGKQEPAASEVKSGMLERKSKYLKSYTPGWYALSTTHLHEFKSPDRISSQAPVMSLALADQKLGSHSNAESTSHKFMLKGRQSRGMHRGHAWVFRAESYDTMLAWFSDIRNLTEKTGAERNAFIQRTHARSLSAGSHNRANSISSDGMEEDEADQVPYSATPSQADISVPQEELPQRPDPVRGRFPSALAIDRGLQVPLSPSSNESSDSHEVVAAAGALPGSGVPFGESGKQVHAGDDETKAERGELAAASGAPLRDHADTSRQLKPKPLPHSQETESEPIKAYGNSPEGPGAVAHSDKQPKQLMGPAAGATGGVAVGVAGIEAYRQQQNEKRVAPLTERPRSQVLEQTSTPSALGAGNDHADPPVQGAIFAAIAPTSRGSNHSAPTTDINNPNNFEGPESHLSDPAAPIRKLAEAEERPTLGLRVDTASDLHFPGEFPKGKLVID